MRASVGKPSAGKYFGTAGTDVESAFGPLPGMNADFSKKATQSGDTMIDRRSFIQFTALLGTMPALATLLPLLPMAQDPLLTAVDPIETSIPAFKISGWDHCAEKGSNGNEVWLRINQSWRVAWT